MTLGSYWKTWIFPFETFSLQKEGFWQFIFTSFRPMEKGKNPREPELCFKKISILNLQYKLAKQPLDILIIQMKLRPIQE